jgi:hypothetical protein
MESPMNNSATLIEVHKAEIARLRNVGGAMIAALRNFIEATERDNASAPK